MKVFLSYALSIAGLGFVIWAMAGASAVNLSYLAGKHNIINMLRQSANKAELMCKARKGTFYEPIGAAIKIAAMAQTEDLNILAMSTKPAYDGTVILVTLHWKKLLGHGKKAALLVGGGLALAIAAKGHIIFQVLVTIVTAICALWFLVTRAQNERALLLARAEILPEVDRSFAEGRYVRYQ